MSNEGNRHVSTGHYNVMCVVRGKYRALCGSVWFAYCEFHAKKNRDDIIIFQGL